MNKVYADFQKTDGQRRLVLTCKGTQDDLSRMGITLREGLKLQFYTDDMNGQDLPDNLIAEGTVLFNAQLNVWVAEIDWDKIRYESEPDPGKTM